MFLYVSICFYLFFMALSDLQHPGVMAQGPHGTAPGADGTAASAASRRGTPGELWEGS